MAEVTARTGDPLLENNRAESLVAGANSAPVIMLLPDISVINRHPGSKVGVARQLLHSNRFRQYDGCDRLLQPIIRFRLSGWRDNRHLLRPLTSVGSRRRPKFKRQCLGWAAD
jgi:hypothetical protein